MYAPYMTVQLVIFLPKMLYAHLTYMARWPTLTESQIFSLTLKDAQLLANLRLASPGHASHAEHHNKRVFVSSPRPLIEHTSQGRCTHLNTNKARHVCKCVCRAPHKYVSGAKRCTVVAHTKDYVAQ
jgi:hypothetical protein